MLPKRLPKYYQKIVWKKNKQTKQMSKSNSAVKDKDIDSNVQHPGEGSMELRIHVGDVVQNDGFVQ